MGATCRVIPESPLQTIKDHRGCKMCRIRIIAVIVSSPTMARPGWWRSHPQDGADARPRIAAQDLSVPKRSATAECRAPPDNTTVAATPVGKYIVTGPQQFRYNRHEHHQDE